MKNKALYICTLTALLAPVASQATLLMTVDSVNETLTFGTTSDTGTPLEFTGALTYWQVDFGSFTANDVTLGINASLLTDGTTAGNAELTFDSSSTPYIGVSVFEGTAYSSIAGSGAIVSYAGLASDLKTALEGLAGANTAIPLMDGTGFGAISTTLVPEPSTYGFVAGVAMLGLCVLRRRRA